MASYNRYQGNTGRVTRVDERRAERPPEEPPRQYPAPRPPEEPPRQYPAPRPPDAPKPRQLPLLGGSLADLLPKSFGELETEDIILLLILYLMYRESGDSELLIIMGAMFLL